MYKIFNVTMISIVLIFIFYIFQHYTSNKNIIEKDYKRLNLDKLLNEKISDLPILKNDTINVIEYLIGHIFMKSTYIPIRSHI